MIFQSRLRSRANWTAIPRLEDLLEGCRVAGPDFIVNVVLNPNAKLIRVVAGHYDLAHREGCRTVDSMMRVAVGTPYDLIVASAGGFPWDIDLRQAHKRTWKIHAWRCVREARFCFTPNARAAGAHDRLKNSVNRYSDDFEMREALEREFVVGGHKAFWVARLERLYLMSAFGLEVSIRISCGAVTSLRYRPPIMKRRCGICWSGRGRAWR